MILRNLINVPTCYKYFDNPTSVNIILTNRLSCFQHSTAFETGLSDFHLLTITWLNEFSKQEPKIIKYRDYKSFSNNQFRSEILKCNLRTFKETVFHIFNKYAQIKKSMFAPFMTKELHKAIMKRSRLINCWELQKILLQ